MREKLRADAEEKKRALEKAKNAFSNMPVQAADSGQSTDPEEAERHALAVAGHHISDRTCVPANDAITGILDSKEAQDGKLKGWARNLKADKGIKFKEVWVQHRDESATKGQVAIYFFPTGSSEKSVIEMTDGKEIFSILVYGLTGRVELKDGVLKDVNDHMLRNAMGDKNARREEDK